MPPSPRLLQGGTPFDEAQKSARRDLVQACNHDDWRVPTKNELNVLFNNRAALDGFGVSPHDPDGWHWSSSSDDEWRAWGQRFSDGLQDTFDINKVFYSRVRLVR
jgi:hypothetical protein